MHYQPLQPGCYYHIYNRGNNKEDIFIENKNYDYFLSLAKKHLTPVSEILAYCLLKNHFHFLVRINDDVSSGHVSRSFSNLFNAYAKAINKAYGRTGSLFQDRFSRRLVEKEHYLMRLIPYIHLNPIHHGFSDSFSDYKFSSYQFILNGLPGVVSRDHVVELFGSIQSFKEAHEVNVADVRHQDLTGLQDL